MTNSARSFVRRFAILVIFAMALAGCGVEHYVVGRSYINKTHGFGLQCPSDKAWFFETEGDMVKVRNNKIPAGYMGCAVVINTGSEKVDDFTERYLKEVFKQFSTPSNVKKHRMQIAGYPAYAIEFSDSFDYTPMQNIIVGSIAGNKAFVFTLVLPVLKYKENRKAFLEFVQSLKIGKL